MPKETPRPERMSIEERQRSHCSIGSASGHENGRERWREPLQQELSGTSSEFASCILLDPLMMLTSAVGRQRGSVAVPFR